MATESSLKTMKNGFYFTLKALFVLNIFKFLPWLFGHVRKRLDRKDKVNFKICGVKTCLTNYWKPISTKISRNQAIKFGQLIEYNLRNIFLEESCTKCGGETSFRPFFNESKLNISLDKYSKVLYIFFSLFTKLRTIETDRN